MKLPHTRELDLEGSRAKFFPGIKCAASAKPQQ